MIATIAAGHLAKTKTTRLYSASEFVAALKKSQGLAFKAPKG